MLTKSNALLGYLQRSDLNIHTKESKSIAKYVQANSKGIHHYSMARKVRGSPLCRSSQVAIKPSFDEGATSV